VALPTEPSAPRVLLTVDVEDWNQLLDRRVGIERPPSTAFRAQMHALFGALEELGARATFFVLGTTAADHPHVVAEIGEHGHEIACHGYLHERVYQQTPADFRADVERSLQIIERIASVRPEGYRAPIFSINRDSVWAYEILEDLGFRYDASLCSSPWVSNQIRPMAATPYRIDLTGGRELWEFPVASCSVARCSVPVGGASYWRFLPRSLHMRLLLTGGRPYPLLYVHPYECDPEPLRANLPSTSTGAQRRLARRRECWRNFRRETPLARLHAIGEHYGFSTCSDALVSLASAPKTELWLSGTDPARAVVAV
jgi:polysaccharide deacetylase family protein (PEP-CTERM system associated)